MLFLCDIVQKTFLVLSQPFDNSEQFDDDASQFIPNLFYVPSKVADQPSI